MELLERASVLDALGGLLAEARAGRGRLVLVGGEAGVGKTSLVREACAPRAPRRRDPVGRLRPAEHAPAARELEVLALVAEGLRNADIARRLTKAAAAPPRHAVYTWPRLDIRRAD